MKQKFVIDENIIYFAERLTDTNGHDDVMSLVVVGNIIAECHTIVVDPALQTKYDGIFERLELDSKGVRGPAITRMLTQIRNNRPKYIFLDYAPSFDGEDQVPSDDLTLVRLAVASQGMLVTRDGRLIDRIRSSNLQRKYGLRVGTPEEVFTMISRP